MRVEYRQAIEISDIRGNPPQVFYLFLVGNALLEDGFSLALELPEHEQHELIQILDF